MAVNDKDEEFPVIPEGERRPLGRPHFMDDQPRGWAKPTTENDYTTALSDDDRQRLVATLDPYLHVAADSRLFAAVQRIVAGKQREWENAVLRRCVETMPAAGEASDFIHTVTTAMLALRCPPGQETT